MKKHGILKFTVVQHSGYGYGGKPGFALAVEPASVTSQAQERKIRKYGGVVLDNYAEAEDFCKRANYPPAVHGLYPQVQGGFSSYRHSGLRIYVPTPGEAPEGAES